MSFPSDKTGLAAVWSDIQSIVDALTGVAGGGAQVALTQYSNSGNYALDVRNLDSTYAYGLRVRDAADSILLQCAKNAIQIGAGTSDVLTIAAAKVYVNDTANANATYGLTINQAGADDEILALKSSDVAHGMTTISETDTYALFKKAVAASGGLIIRGLQATSAGIVTGLWLEGNTQSNADTTKSTSGLAQVMVYAGQISGTSYTNVVADGNLFGIQCRSGGGNVTRLLVDAEGHIHSIGATATDMLGNGLWFINDTANSKMTLGLTINQATNTDEALALKSSDVAHGMTTDTETDTYGFLKQASANGGANLGGFAQTGTTMGLALQGYTVDAADTTKSTSGVGLITLAAGIKSGTTTGAAGADANLMVLRSAGLGGTTRFIWDVEGSFHADVESTTYDQYDDVALLNALDSEFQRRQGNNAVGREFGTWLAEHKAILQREKIVNFYSEDGPRVMVNFTRLAMLHTGAIRQLSQRLQIAEQRLAALPSGEISR